MSALVSGGLAAAIAAISVAMIQTFGKKSESRAHAADLITDAAGSLACRQSDTIDRLEKRVDRQTRAILALTAVLDDMLPKVVLSDPERVKLQRAITAAKLSL